MTSDTLIRRLDRLLVRDPAGRGLSDDELGLGVSRGQSVWQAAESLAASTGGVALVTGFAVVDVPCPTAETDGPPGALYLAALLAAAGREITLIGDDYARPLLEAGADHFGLPRDAIVTCPFEDDDPASALRASNEPVDSTRSAAWCEELLNGPRGLRFSHLLAIERAGPSHTADSVAGQATGEADRVERFRAEVPSSTWNLCHNMRGESINAHTAKTHLLFEMASAPQRPITTIGLADGGNEIGAGCLPWDRVRRAVRLGPGGIIACRIATDHLLLAGVSDWAAYALAAVYAQLAGRVDCLAPWNVDHQRALVERLVHEAGAVDGVTRRAQASVDGLPLETYLQPLGALRQWLGLSA